VTYEGLNLIKFNKEKKNGLDKFKTELEENQVAISLGQVCQVAIHMSRCLSQPLKHPIIFNSHRSYVVECLRSETVVHPLFATKNQEYKTFEKAVKLMESNLRNILRTLERIKKDQGIGIDAQSLN
jgi:hypothetical protein